MLPLGMQDIQGDLLTSTQKSAAVRRATYGDVSNEEWIGISLGFTKDGLIPRLEENRPRMEAAFECGADATQTVAALHGPAPGTWVAKFRSDRIDGIFPIAGRSEFSVTFTGNAVRAQAGGSLVVVS